MVSYRAVEEFALTLPETTSSPSYNHAPALRVNKRILGRLRAEMADEYDDLTGAPYDEVLMLKVADLGEKEALLASDPRVYFTVAHYDGYPAILIRLAQVSEEEVRELVMETWMRLAPKRALRSYVNQGGVLPGGDRE